MDSGHGAGVDSFIERFGDLFSDGFSSIFGALGFGALLAWIWLGISDGYPIFTSGYVDLVAVMALLASFSLTLLGISVVRSLQTMLCQRSSLVVSVVLAMTGCVALAVIDAMPEGFDEAIVCAFMRCCMVPVGMGAALLFSYFGVFCCRFKPASTVVVLACSTFSLFVAYFCISCFGSFVARVMFCCLPALAAASIWRSFAGIAQRLSIRPAHSNSYAKGYLQLVAAFAVFYFAMGAIRSMEPVNDFATSSSTSVVGVFVVGFVAAFCVASKKKVGTFRVLKRMYSAAIIALVACVVLSPLSLDPVYSFVYNTDCLVLLVNLWLLLSYVARENDTYVLTVFGFALGLSAMGMAFGWFAGSTIYEQLGHDRFFFSIAIGCAVAVFCTVGFSPRSFPRLTLGGEGAKKAEKKEPAVSEGRLGDPSGRLTDLFSRSYNLSPREMEVFCFLSKGYGADYISEKLVVSYYTARTHIRNIYKKLEVHSQEELLDLAAQFEKDHASAQNDHIE